MSYRIEDLDIYRRCIATAASLCRLADEAAGRGSVSVGAEIRRRGIAMAANVADGLGFWEKEEKVLHFTAAKKAVLESLALLELAAALDAADADTGRKVSVELRDLSRMTAGLLRGARRREPEAEGAKAGTQAVREPCDTWH